MDRDGNRVRCPSPAAAAAAVQYTFPPADILSAEEALLRSLGITASPCASTMNEIKCSPGFYYTYTKPGADPDLMLGPWSS